METFALRFAPPPPPSRNRGHSRHQGTAWSARARRKKRHSAVARRPPVLEASDGGRWKRGEGTNKGADEEEEESKAEFVPYRSATLTLSASGSEQISATGMPKLCRDSLGELEGREGRGSRSSRSSRAGARTGGREVSRTSAGPSLAARSRTRLL
ncbi:unnamed protein product, partial [Prorocentrum cordatum]